MSLIRVIMCYTLRLVQPLLMGSFSYGICIIFVIIVHVATCLYGPSRGYIASYDIDPVLSEVRTRPG